MYNIRNIKERLNKKGDELILYHGSRGGIEGDIKPESRSRCDFGRGFYMGTNPQQVKGLVVEDASPVLYTIRLPLSEVNPDNILFLEDEKWLYAILAHRGRVEEFNGLKAAEEIKAECLEYDFLIGSIADDRMNEAMKRFAENGLTDEGLKGCLESVNYGVQVVAKTQRACRMLEIISERDISGKEADDIRRYIIQKRQESKDVVDKMSREYVRKGLYLSEIIDKEKLKEKTDRPSDKEKKESKL